LGFVPGLSEHFVLINDDVFFGAMTKRTDFLTDKGQPVLYFERHPVRGGREEYLQFKKERRNGWLGMVYHTKSLMDMRHGWNRQESWTKYRYLKHSPHVYSRSRLVKLWEIWGKELAETATHHFRSADDIISLFLHHHYCMLDEPGKCVLGGDQASMDAVAHFLKVGDSNAVEKLAMIGAARPKFFTVNDEADRLKGPSRLKMMSWVYGTWLPAMFPEPSEYEDTSRCGGREWTAWGTVAGR
jgi:hypothetical protein